MPIYVGYTQKRRRVRILTAGDTQYLLCPPSDIEMLAVLNDVTNLRNYVLHWEQIFGPTVPLASTDTLGTSFPFADTEDKIFRFYLDPGTNQEQYKDVEIFYTPTSIMNKNAAIHQRDQETATTHAIEKENSFLFPAPAGLNTNVQATLATKFSWDLNSPDVNLSGRLIKVELLSSPVWVPDPDIVEYTWEPPEDFPDTITVDAGVYRMRMTYDLNGYIKSFVSPLMVSNPVQEGNYWIIDAPYPSGYTQPAMTNLVRFSLKNQVEESEQSIKFLAQGKLGSGLVPNSTTRLTGVTIGPATYPDLLDEFNLFQAFLGRVENITRLDPSNIGND